ncbi:MAG: glycogen/starch/alpha-glucan phosphorylase [Chromatiales bacterium]|nr:glycogen/starch/alpha-glucan phosphorylase [Chromatiales bacterium]
MLYPDDTTPQGKELRFKQQYFFVSASLQDMLAQHLAEDRRARVAARRVGDPAERHAPGARHPRADPPAGRRARDGVGARLGHHAARVLVHQPHAAARGARGLAGGVLRARAAAPPADHLPASTARSSTRSRRASPRDSERRSRMSLIDEGHGRQRAHGAPRGRRRATPSTAWRSCTRS